MPTFAGIPHRLMQSDFHAGYFLPKGTAVIANIWSVLTISSTMSLPLQLTFSRYVVHRKFLHDHRKYSDPFIFRP